MGLNFYCSALLLIAVLQSLAVQADAQGAGYWHTSANKILDANGDTVRIAGVNWYGFETSDEVVHGVWAQDYHTILNAIKNNGYNTIRVPFSNQMVESPIIPSNISFSNSSGPINTDLRGLNSLQILDKIVAYAGQIGLRIILDNHRSSAGNGTESELWYTSAYPESAWIHDWQTLASRYANNPTVIGVDLRNEPHGAACWGCGSATTDWRLAAERGGDAVQSINPNLLIFVEGTDCYNGDCDWWGGNLEGAQTYPVALNTPNHLVYSAHDYGPNLYGQSWFNGSTTYSTLAAVWTKFWGYLSEGGIAPVWVGEFGTTNNNSDIENSSPGSQGQWFQSLVTYLQNNSTINWTYWALNGEDSYALLDSNYDPTPANALKQQLLASIQSPLSGGSSGGPTTPPPAPTNLSAAAVSSNQINLNWAASTTSGVTYDVYASTTSGFAPSTSTRIASGITSTSFQEQGLTASTTYYYLVTAVDSNGESAPSNQASATTQAGTSGGASCQVSYSDTNDWGSGSTASVSITNTGASAINSWSLVWTWAGNQQVTQAWNANYSQSGPTVTLTNASWNGSIAPGATVSGIGFNANYSGTNTAPAAFYLNGARCNGSGSTGGSAPAAPANLTAKAVSASQINLAWNASSTSGVTYDVYASTSSSVSAPAAYRVASGITGTSFQHQSLAASTTYYYVVTAVNSSGESTDSNEASATTQAGTAAPPVAPSGLTASAASSSQINLNWAASATAGVTYNVYENTSPKFSSANRVATNITTTSFQQQGLSPSTTYYYVVTAVDSAGESGYSNQASASTEAASGGSASCHVSYTDQNDWGTGFTAGISITNNGASAIRGWTLTWSWPGNQQISGAWNATLTQTGNKVSLGSESYNGTISPGATVTGIGFNANYSGSNTAPTVFYVNGVQCK